MQNWLNPRQKEIVEKSVKFFDSLDKRQRAYFYDMFSDKKLKSHINAIVNGCVCICSSDEYNPFCSGDYIIYSFVESEVLLQIAWSKFYQEIYVSGYVPKKDGWYEWIEYHKGIAAFRDRVDIPRGKNKTISFDEALREAKKRVAVTKNKAIENNSQTEGIKSSKITRLQEEKEYIGLQIFFEKEDSTSDYRKISIPSIQSLQTLKNRLLAIRSLQSFNCDSINRLYVEGVGEAIVKNISKNTKKISPSQDYVYFVMYDGVNFLYYCDTNQKGRI